MKTWQTNEEKIRKRKEVRGEKDIERQRKEYRKTKGGIRIKGESGRRDKEEREESLQFIKVLWRISLCVLVVRKYIYRNTYFTITAPVEYKIC
jgi:hypothetical protein